MSNIYKAGMTYERYELLSNPSFTGFMSEEESDAGWHFCNTGWDGMLIHLTDDEIEFCECSFHTQELCDKVKNAKQEIINKK